MPVHPLSLSLGLVAGLAAGSALGYLVSKWMKEQHDQAQAEATAFNAILDEIHQLRELLRETKEQLEVLRPSTNSRTSLRPLDTESEYFSTYDSAGEDEEDFFDLPPETPETNDSTITEPKSEYECLLVKADDLGKKTLQSEDVCDELIALLLDGLDKNFRSSDILWRLARAHMHKSLFYKARGETEAEKDCIMTGEKFAVEAVEVQEDNWQAHKWFAVLTGSGTRFVGTNEKIQRGHKYKEHIDIAIQLNPNEANLYFFLGMWCFEVASLSWLERKAASMLYGAPPETSYEEALENFTKAEDLLPGQWKNNELMIAKCHLRLRQKEQASEWLIKASCLPTITSEDKENQVEIEQLLQSNGY